MTEPITQAKLPIAPDDAHNRTLIGNVHPPDWTNPEPTGRYDLLVVGGGTGGLVSAAIGAALGARVALVERHLLGGDCLNVGCVPSKAIIRASRAWAEARAAAERFGGPPLAGEAGDFGAVMERMRRIRAEISGHDAAARFQNEYGVDVYLGGGRFTGQDSLEVGGSALRFRRAIIATGARAAAPPIEGLEDAGYLTNETLYELTDLPRRLGIIGGGPIGTEMAQAFARLGSEVTILDMSDRILPHDDEDAAEVVLRALESDGVRFVGKVEIERVEAGEGERTVHYMKDDRAAALTVDALLVAAGRQPNVDGLGLEAAGVEYDEREGVRVNHRLQTSNAKVFAVGDVVPGLKFTHLSDRHARSLCRTPSSSAGPTRRSWSSRGAPTPRRSWRTSACRAQRPSPARTRSTRSPSPSPTSTGLASTEARRGSSASTSSGERIRSWAPPWSGSTPERSSPRSPPR